MGALQTHACKGQCLVNGGEEDRKEAGGTTSGNGQGLAAVTSWRQPGTGRDGGGWFTSTQIRPYGPQTRGKVKVKTKVKVIVCDL